MVSISTNFMVEIRNKPETNSERCNCTVNLLYISLRTAFQEWHGLRIIVWQFGILLCTEVSQITSDVSLSVVKSVQDRYKSKSDEKPCVIIESSARSTRLVDMTLVSVNRDCSRKLVAVALFHEDLVGKLFMPTCFVVIWACAVQSTRFTLSVQATYLRQFKDPFINVSSDA